LKITPILSALLAAAVIVPALATPSLAQAPAPAPRPAPFVPERDPTKITAGAYVVEPMHTRVMFGISHKGFTTFYGEFPGASGTLTLDPKNPAASVFDITVPVTNISTQNKVLDEELRNKPWLDAPTYPTIEFKSTSVKPTGPTTADVTGDFTFHGVTKPLTLHVKFNAAGMDPQDKIYVAGFSVTGGFKRTDWGFKTAAPLIGDDIDLIISAAFKKAPA
jgi:polyisoprenoid-binding protein YceI